MNKKNSKGAKKGTKTEELLNIEKGKNSNGRKKIIEYLRILLKKLKNEKKKKGIIEYERIYKNSKRKKLRMIP